MRQYVRLGLVVLAPMTIACGNAGEANGEGSESGGISDTSPTTDEATSGGTDSESTSRGSMDSGNTTSGSGLDSSSKGDSEDSGPKFDIGLDTDGDTDGVVDCECGSQIGFSYIWIANSTQSTVTKLNTQTMAEEGRYLTRDDQAGNPSRTSVSIDARAVAVANRNGGLVKVWARPEFCDPMKNGQPGLQTSNDTNYLPWDEDDCVDWYTHFDYTTQRPVAWGPGTMNPATCEYEDQVVWTAGCNTAVHQWAQVHIVDGDTGVVLNDIDVAGFECQSLSPYGAAIDPDGDYWMTNLVPGQDRLAHIGADGTLIEVINPPITPYGMTVDSQGRVWLASWSSSGSASAARYNPFNSQWDLATNHVASSLSGIQEDAEGRMWMNYWSYDGDGTNPGLVYIDGETMEVSEPFGIGCGPSACRGISVDLDGNVWSTSMTQNTAFRYNPESGNVDTYDQLVGPYTYSDMTGWALQNTSCDPEG